MYNIIQDKITHKIDIILLEKLDKLYLDARYPSELGLLPDGKPAQDDAREFFRIASSTRNHIFNILNIPCLMTMNMADTLQSIIYWNRAIVISNIFVPGQIPQPVENGFPVGRKL